LKNRFEFPAFRDVGPGALSQFVTIAFQIISVPIFLHYWDLETYGLWLLLVTTQNYISLSDVGLASAVGNSMTMNYAIGEYSRAKELFTALKGALVVIGLGVTFLAALAIQPILNLLGSTTWASAEPVIVSFIFVVGVAVAQYASAFEAVARATGRLGLSINLSTLSRSLEWMGWIVGLVILGSMVGVALVGLAGRLVGSLLIALIALKHDGSMFKVPLKFTSLKYFQNEIKPTLGKFAFNASSAISLQGAIAIVGSLFGTAAVAVFSTHRTLFRTLVQVVGTLSYASTNEFAKDYMTRNTARLVKRKNDLIIINLGLLILFATAIFFLGSPLLSFWTNGDVTLDPALTALLFVYTVFASLSYPSRTALVSTNNNGRLGVVLFISALIGLVVSFESGLLFGLYGLVLSVCAVELLNYASTELEFRRTFWRKTN
jgi:O-antigen/teichoic acid export membrane protein